ncbi:MAG: hypothetical protein AB6733_12230 [Clostridiaceae bacterium]
MKKLEGWEVLKLITEGEIKVGTILKAEDKNGLTGDENDGVWLIVAQTEDENHRISLKRYIANNKEIRKQYSADYLLYKRFWIA